MQVTLPNAWSPRPYQQSVLKYLSSGGKRAVAVWHRRAGKDVTALNWTACAAHLSPGIYWHMLPTAQQGRIVIWDGRDNDGRSLLDKTIPPELRKKTRNDEIKIELKCGSIWQVVGSDNYDRLVGANPKGVVFSEYALTDPRAWDYVRPILVQNGGWALFIFTPRGKNHAYDLYQMALHTKGWFAETLTADDTGIITKEQIEAERQAGMSDAMIRQEFFCSFEAPNESSYYGKLLEEAEHDGRIMEVPIYRNHAVDTWWDIGIGDSTAIWFAQRIGQEIHLVDYYEAHSEGLSHYAKVLQDKGYVYGVHYAPHDIEARELGTGISRFDVAAQLGIKFRVVPKTAVEDGIEAVRNLLPRCWFDAKKCSNGLKMLRAYHREYHDRNQSYAFHPAHDFSSHGSDAFRYGALAYGETSIQHRHRTIIHARNASFMST